MSEPKKPSGKEYLGDGLYAEGDGFGIKVTAENGISVLETCYFEPMVLDALISYAERKGYRRGGGK
jgi:hypothetical protein